MIENESLTILIAEDNIPAQQLLSKVLTKKNYKVLLADNGQSAVDLYQQHQPDIMLCDINMPVMNGHEAIKQIRSLGSESWMPILILSASDQDNDIIKGLESGADDYLPKPINLDVLHAKVKVMQRLVSLQKHNNETNLQLTLANEELEKEQIVAKQLADKMLGMSDLNVSHIDYWLCPNRHFSGDLIATSYANDHTLFVMLADSTGHGLAASLPTLTIARTFHSMTKKGFTLSSIVNEMNSIAKALLPADRFVAANLYAINFQHQTIESWCGGIPDSLIVDQQGKVIHSLSSKHLAIGILPEQAFDASTDIYTWQEPVELITYSDGLSEAESAEGQFFGEDELVSLIQSSPETQRVSAVKSAVLNHLEGDIGQDDMSILAVQCS